jgi:hypothetical protein
LEVIYKNGMRTNMRGILNYRKNKEKQKVKCKKELKSRRKVHIITAKEASALLSVPRGI